MEQNKLQLLQSPNQTDVRNLNNERGRSNRSFRIEGRISERKS